jgi:predicted negative regulator of RcsB-dependent stress response
MLSAYTDQEELDKLKAWWKEYGTALVIGVAIGVALLFGGKYWQSYQERQQQEASALYERMLQSQRGNDVASLRDAGRKLVQDYPRTPYAALAALSLARAAMEAGDIAGARSELESALKLGSGTAVEHVARLRLGRLLLDAREAEKVLALIPGKAVAGYQADYLELKGDALAALGRREEAAAAFQEASKYPRQGRTAATLTLKLDEFSASNAPKP